MAIFIFSCPEETHITNFTRMPLLLMHAAPCKTSLVHKDYKCHIVLILLIITVQETVSGSPPHLQLDQTFMLGNLTSFKQLIWFSLSQAQLDVYLNKGRRERLVQDIENVYKHTSSKGSSCILEKLILNSYPLDFDTLNAATTL